MKALLSLLAAAAVLGFAAPSTAKADCQGQTRVVGYTSCGTPIIAVYRIVGYDGYGRPVGQWVTQQPQMPQYGYGGYNSQPAYGQSGYGQGYGYGQSGYGYSGHHSSHGHSHHGFSFGFGR